MRIYFLETDEIITVVKVEGILGSTELWLFVKLFQHFALLLLFIVGIGATVNSIKVWTGTGSTKHPVCVKLARRLAGTYVKAMWSCTHR